MISLIKNTIVESIISLIRILFSSFSELNSFKYLFFKEDNKLLTSCKYEKSYYLFNKSNIKYETEEYVIMSFFDITKRKRLEKDLEFEQNMFETLCNELPESIVLFSDEIIYSNLILRKKFKYTKATLANKSFSELISNDDKELFYTYIENIDIDKNKDFIFKMKRKDDIEFWAKLKTKKLEKENGECFYLSLIVDITNEKLKLEKLNQLANYDKLTEVINRRKFDELLLQEYKRSKRYEINTCGLFLDIDHFKNINDTYGHDIGDSVLVELSTLVKKHIRDTDIFARWGGEEFVLILTQIDIESAEKIAENLRMTIESNSFKKVNKVTTSMGLSKLKNNERLSTFLKRLDSALYKAKKGGRNRVEIL